MLSKVLCLSAAVALCAGAAVAQSPECPGTGDCFEQNGTPGCDEVSCCLGVCAVDPFCCDAEWDSLCASTALSLCAPACPSDCVGDLNDDGSVDGADLGILLENWGGAGCGDLDGNGVVDGADLGILLENWGDCPLTCGDAAAGSCCESNGTPFCDDEACCEAVCAQDPFCCDVTWDGACASQANDLCEGCLSCGNDSAGSCCDANGTPFCDDEACCEAVCAQDPFCCDVSWDGACANQANAICEGCLSCGNETAGSCCDANGTPFCDDAACCEAVCAQDPFCCDVTWDGACASQANAICEGCLSCGNETAGSCCDANGTPYCDDAACCEAVCAVDPFCCDVAWDNACVSQVASVCGQADCIGAACDHSPCVEGAALDAGCDACVAQICDVDPFCCDAEWDAICVDQVASVCDLTCP